MGTLTTNGLDRTNPDWGDMAYDPQNGYWYAGFNTADRDPSTTEGFSNGLRTATSFTGFRMHPF